MPTYEYQCEKCKNKFEIVQSMTAVLLKSCPKCKGKVRRLIGSGAGIIFKGSGFYATDYRKGSPRDAEKGEAKSAKSCPGFDPASSSCSSCKK